jgi:hypothetical protein
MRKEPKPMREIHQIQERFFEKERKLSSRERIRKLHKEATDIIKKYGLKIKTARKFFVKGELK